MPFERSRARSRSPHNNPLLALSEQNSEGLCFSPGLPGPAALRSANKKGQEDSNNEMMNKIEPHNFLKVHQDDSADEYQLLMKLNKPNHHNRENNINNKAPDPIFDDAADDYENRDESNPKGKNDFDLEKELKRQEAKVKA